MSATVAAASLADRVVGVVRRSPTFAIGFAIILAYGFVAVFADVLAPLPPTLSFPYDTLKPPGTGQFILGTDGNGMDVLSRTLHGARYAFGIAVPAGAIMAVVGIPLGLLAGWRGGWLDEVLLRILDVMRAFPTIILAMAVVAAMGPGFLNVILVIGFLDSPIFARIVRAEVLALRNATFVRAAVAAGNPEWRVLLVHILPNVILGATAQLPLRMAWAVRISATLAFIGIGVQAPAPEWGAMIRQGAEYVISGEWWVALFPGLALIGMVLGLNLAGDGLSDLLDPKRRASGK
jgi:peptide/nickel transport system permease protein